MTVTEFIKEHFPASVIETKEDVDNRFGLPHPYTVPSPGDIFDCMFYWDTHFTNVGLLATGDVQQAIYNTDNIRHLIRRFGYMPNSSKVHHLGQSQPPFYYRMVWDVFAVTGDTRWLAEHYDTIAMEYDFWMTKRKAPNGLNYYGKDLSHLTEQEIRGRFPYAKSRFSGFDTEDYSKIQAAVGTVAVLCESGWDCCYRFEMDGYHYLPVDLNTLLYGLESAMAHFSEILEKGEKTLWEQRAQTRKALMDQYMWNPEKGFYMDWNYETGKFSPVVSVASLFPLYLGLDHDPKGIMSVLQEKMLLPYGVSPTAPTDHGYHLQWEYPNIWAPLQYVAYCACIRGGREDLAKTVAERYTGLLEENFRETGNLWEKYNGLTGETDHAEYQAPPMMGWTAGVYLYLKTQIIG